MRKVLRQIGMLFGALVVAQLVSDTAQRGAAQRAPLTCPSEVKPAATRFGYRKLDDRCEGEFQREVGSSIDVVSLTLGSLPRPSGASASISLSWPNASLTGVSITGRVLYPHIYYRMDAAPVANASQLTWPLNDLNLAGHGRKRLAIKLKALSRASSGARTVLVPVRPVYSDGEPSTQPTEYVLALVSGDEVQSVRARLVDAVSGTDVVLWEDREVIEGDISVKPAYPIFVSVPLGNRGPGLYRLDLAAKTKLSALPPLHVEFVHE